MPLAIMSRRLPALVPLGNAVNWLTKGRFASAYGLSAFGAAFALRTCPGSRFHQPDDRSHQVQDLNSQVHGQFTSFLRKRRCQHAGLTPPTVLEFYHDTRSLENKCSKSCSTLCQAVQAPLVRRTFSAHRDRRRNICQVLVWALSHVEASFSCACLLHACKNRG